MPEPSFDFGLRFMCPRCGATAEDELETLDAFVPADWRCERCDRCFNVLLAECIHCAGETVSVALAGTEQFAPGEVVCSVCGKRCVDHGEAAFNS